jgi:hypothetical protein
MLAARPLHPLLHRLVVLALVACSFACCGRQGTAAAAESAADEPAHRPCCAACLAHDSSSREADNADSPRHGDDDGRRHSEGRCLGACCTKADFKPPHFMLACDLVGAPIPAIAVRGSSPTDPLARRAVRLDEDVGEPPPWRLLLVSARLRI